MIKKIALFFTMFAAILVMVVNRFIFSLPDWVVRLDGIIMIVLIITMSYFTSKRIRLEGRKNEK